MNVVRVLLIALLVVHVWMHKEATTVSVWKATLVMEGKMVMDVEVLFNNLLLHISLIIITSYM